MNGLIKMLKQIEGMIAIGQMAHAGSDIETVYPVEVCVVDTEWFVRTMAADGSEAWWRGSEGGAPGMTTVSVDICDADDLADLAEARKSGEVA